ncbi:MAG: TldD/PmbA family protein [Armatimonadota bacterium]|nr:TldD/PmbA family protein [Armatimonadota bacterium]MDR7451609.1 TldD/PmbA family protein [Armatimonadota bacterium]MDR7467671.1 TldD/PmbA family protein [Armatimonadota bacterium]MDR7492578.1 TldD/PmbA family protein [Armatimonadota bacterium]MDR7499954.1 TldD/PmbA family protein [Armatimonadota bacterium]
MLAEALVADVLARARRGGASFAELYVERWKRRALRVLNGEVKEATSGREYGAGLRLFYGTEVAYAYTNDLTPQGLHDAVEYLVRAKGTAGRVDHRGAGGVDFRRAAAAGLHLPQVPHDDQPRRYRLDRLREADAGARVAPEIVQVEGTLQEWEQDVLVANSDGTWTEDHRVRTRLSVTAIAQDGRTVQTGVAWEGLSVGLELFDHHPPREVGRRAGTQALTNLRAHPAPAGTMPVVLGNGFGGVIFHEAVGHLLETTSVAKKASVLSEMIGEQVASPVVTYVDDGTIPHGWGSSEFDDEGAPTQRTVLIERGVLKSYMVDRWGSLLTGYAPTGSGRRQDYTFAPTSRMRNTFITAGDTPLEALFRQVDDGLYARAFRGGQVRPGSGEYNFGVQEAYRIRRGQIAEPVRGAMLVGKGPETLRRIVAVSTDLRTGSGMCGSLSGSIPAEVGQPHVLVSELVVGGEST